MASTKARPAFKTLLQMADANGANFATVAEVKDINWKMTSQIDETTSHSNLVPFRTYVATLLTFGPVTFPVNWVPLDETHDGTTGLLFVWKNRQERKWRLIDPEGTPIYEFSALIASIDGGAPVAGIKHASISLTSSGEPDFEAS
jgi:hypothetical protein